jgi:hypothetical protein
VTQLEVPLSCARPIACLRDLGGVALNLAADVFACRFCLLTSLLISIYLHFKALERVLMILLKDNTPQQCRDVDGVALCSEDDIVLCLPT